MISRRTHLKQLGLIGTGLGAFPTQVFSHASRDSVPIACQAYTWFSFLRRENISWEEQPEASLERLRESGLTGLEPSFKEAGEVPAWASACKDGAVWTRSMYVNSLLHEEEQWEKSVADALAIAKAAKGMGIRIVVTNPSPIQWGEPEDKTDAQLLLQAQALEHLGRALSKEGMQLAYHTHDMEMRQGAREFHHMLLHTDPAYVHLCLDAHWVYRGAGNSEVALFDIVKLYGERIIELHLRQSHGGIWSEVFEAGDIDYPRLMEAMQRLRLSPHMVLEQAAEEGTPQTMTAVEAIAKSLAYTRELVG